MSRSTRRPLSAFLWLRRNPRRVLPALLVQALVTALVLAVVVPLTAWEATADASIAPLEAYTGVTPLRRQGFDEELSALLDGNPAMERRIPAKALWIDTPGIVGDQNSAMVAVPRAEQEEYLRRVGVRLVEGTLPEAGSDGVVVHRDVLRARGFRLGSRFGRLVDAEDSTPGEFTVVGVLEGRGRVNLFDLDYASREGTVLARIDPFAIVYAKAGRKEESDRWLREATDAEGRRAFRVYDEAHFRAEVRSTLATLRRIVGLVEAAVGVVVVLVTALFHVIAFQARSDEFALLLALGRTRGRLARKLAAETVLSSTAALALGLALGYGCLFAFREAVLAPRAILVDLFDPYALALAAALPAVSAAAGALVLGLRLRRVDPVAVIQRRNA
jgi:hypothetical protein